MQKREPHQYLCGGYNENNGGEGEGRWCFILLNFKKNHEIIMRVI
jgi:hypothetical protein